MPEFSQEELPLNIQNYSIEKDGVAVDTSVLKSENTIEVNEAVGSVGSIPSTAKSEENTGGLPPEIIESRLTQQLQEAENLVELLKKQKTELKEQQLLLELQKQKMLEEPTRRISRIKRSELRMIRTWRDGPFIVEERGHKDLGIVIPIDYKQTECCEYKRLKCQVKETKKYIVVKGKMYMILFLCEEHATAYEESNSYQIKDIVD